MQKHDSDKEKRLQAGPRLPKVPCRDVLHMLCIYIYIVYIYIGTCIRIHYMLKFIQPAGQNALSGLFSHFSCSFIIELRGLQHTEATTPFQVCKIMLINIEC